MTYHKRSTHDLTDANLSDAVWGEPLRLVCIGLSIAWVALVWRIVAEWL